VADNWLRKLPRRIFTALAVLSLLLCLASIVFWVRGYVASDHLFLNSGGKVAFALSSRVDWVEVSFGTTLNTLDSDGWSYYSFPPSHVPGWRIGFRRYPLGGWAVTAPHCVFAAGFAILPTTQLVRFVRSRKNARGFPVTSNAAAASPNVRAHS
jgi:hypothetical protein